MKRGFSNVREVFASPTDLFRMHIFRTWGCLRPLASLGHSPLAAGRSPSVMASCSLMYFPCLVLP
jgi:hypothetical protein